MEEDELEEELEEEELEEGIQRAELSINWEVEILKQPGVLTKQRGWRPLEHAGIFPLQQEMRLLMQEGEQPLLEEEDELEEELLEDEEELDEDPLEEEEQM